ncbi:sensor histidine kinase [Paenibacillus rhizoplanae]
MTVEEEIEHVQCYLGIQKFRFNFNIETVIELDEEVRRLHTPKLILQPIVENAIIHAFWRDGVGWYHPHHLQQGAGQSGGVRGDG